MKPAKVLVLAASAVLTYLPVTAAAFGFGMSKYEYPPGPWAPYPPYAPVPPQGSTPQGAAPQAASPYPPRPYGLPPNARDVKAMWGSGPTMSWGHKFKHEPPKPPQWRYTKDWTYVSPYSEEASKQRRQEIPDDNPWKRPPER